MDNDTPTPRAAAAPAAPGLKPAGRVFPSAILRAHILARGDEPGAPHWDWAVRGQPRAAAADVERVSMAFDRLLDAALELSVSGARMRAEVLYEGGTASATIAFAPTPSASNPGALAALRARLGPVQAVFVEHGGGLEVALGRMTVVMPLA